MPSLATGGPFRWALSIRFRCPGEISKKQTRRSGQALSKGPTLSRPLIQQLPCDMIWYTICLWTHRKWAAVQVILLQPRKELMCKNKTIATHDSYWQTSCNYIMMLSCMKLLEIVGTLHAQQKKWAQVGSLHTLLLNLTTDLSSRLHSKKNAISLFKNFHPVLANVDISRLTADVMTVTGN
jgi:hypothetical protein